MIPKKPLSSSITATFAGLLLACEPSNAAVLIAGVDFIGEFPTVFDRNPDNYDATGGITVSTGGTIAPVFDGWTLLTFTGGNGIGGNLRQDNGATNAGATTPNFPARLEGGRTGSWSITVGPDHYLHLDRIEFDVRGATGGTGRNGQFRTSLDTDDPFLWGPDNGPYLWENNNLNGRTSGNWQHVVVDLNGSTFQNLTGQTISFIWGTSNAIDLDTIQVYGTVVPVPEPSVIGLLTICTLGLLRRRRRN